MCQLILMLLLLNNYETIQTLLTPPKLNNINPTKKTSSTSTLAPSTLTPEKPSSDLNIDDTKKSSKPLHIFKGSSSTFYTVSSDIFLGKVILNTENIISIKKDSNTIFINPNYIDAFY